MPLGTNVKIIRQMPNTDESKSLVNRAEFANHATAILLLLVFIFQSYLMGNTVLNKLIGMLLALQFVTHLGLLNVKIPGVVTHFNSTLKRVTYFDIFTVVAQLNEVVLPYNY